MSLAQKKQLEENISNARANYRQLEDKFLHLRGVETNAEEDIKQLRASLQSKVIELESLKEYLVEGEVVEESVDDENLNVDAIVARMTPDELGQYTEAVEGEKVAEMRYKAALESLETGKKNIEDSKKRRENANIEIAECNTAKEKLDTAIISRKYAVTRTEYEIEDLDKSLSTVETELTHLRPIKELLEEMHAILIETSERLEEEAELLTETAGEISQEVTTYGNNQRTAEELLRKVRKEMSTAIALKKSDEVPSSVETLRMPMERHIAVLKDAKQRRYDLDDFIEEKDYLNNKYILEKDLYELYSQYLVEEIKLKNIDVKDFVHRTRITLKEKNAQKRNPTVNTPNLANSKHSSSSAAPSPRAPVAK